MRNMQKLASLLVIMSLAPLVTSCATSRSSGSSTSALNVDYGSRLPQTIDSTERTIVVDPRVHAWAAYEGGRQVNAGVASAGANYCRDINSPCRTSSGTFRVQSLGGPDCVSKSFPVGVGGAPMPYCMFFHNGEALHGVPPHEVGEGNYSHGCVRLQVADAEWLRYNFADIGTKVIVKSY